MMSLEGTTTLMQQPGEARHHRSRREIKIEHMTKCSRIQFKFDAESRKALLATGDKEIQCENKSGDTFWCVCHCLPFHRFLPKGENEYGKLLKKLRGEFRSAQPTTHG